MVSLDSFALQQPPLGFSFSPRMSQIIDSQFLSSRYRSAVQECASSMSSFSSGYGYMTPPPSATSRRHSMAMSVDSSGQFLSGSFSNSDSSSFGEPPTPTSSTSAPTSRHHSIAYNTLSPYNVSNSSPDSQQYNEPSTPPDSQEHSNSEFFMHDASYMCAGSSSPFPAHLKPAALDEGFLITMPGISDNLASELASQSLQDGQISSYEEGGAITIESLSGFTPISGLEDPFPMSEVEFGQSCAGLPPSNTISWQAPFASLETVDPSHTFLFSSRPGSPSAHQLGSPIKLEELPPQRTSFGKLSAHIEVSPESSPNMPGHRSLDTSATPTPRNRGLGRLRKVGRISGWKPGNKTTLQFPVCDIRKIEKIETNPCIPCTVILDKRVAFKRPEHLKRHLITDQHTKNVMEYAKRPGVKCPSPIDKPVFPCLIPNCKKGLDKAPFVGRRDNLTQHYKNTHFHDKHKNGGGKNDWISIARAEELGLASKDPRNKEKYEG